LTLEDGALELFVRDEGVGFDVGEATIAADSGRSIGLASMGERVALLGGLLRVNSEPGHGCEVLARFPAGLQQAPFDVSV
jgi:signal transduction histidine kinase